MPQATRQHILERAQEEFREMPGLRLARAQAARLWAPPPTHCVRHPEHELVMPDAIQAAARS